MADKERQEYHDAVSNLVDFLIDKVPDIIQAVPSPMSAETIKTLVEYTNVIADVVNPEAVATIRSNMGISNNMVWWFNFYEGFAQQGSETWETLRMKMTHERSQMIHWNFLLAETISWYITIGQPWLGIRLGALAKRVAVLVWNLAL